MSYEPNSGGEDLSDCERSEYDSKDDTDDMFYARMPLDRVVWGGDILTKKIGCDQLKNIKKAEVR